MKVTVVMFALAKDLAGSGEVEVEVPEPATAGRLRNALVEAYPKLAGVMDRCMLAVNEEYADEQTLIPQGATVACIPPVSGG